MMFVLISRLCVYACIIFAYISASSGDVAGTILNCFGAGLFIWRIEKLKDGDNE